MKGFIFIAIAELAYSFARPNLIFIPTLTLMLPRANEGWITSEGCDVLGREVEVLVISVLYTVCFALTGIDGS